MSARHRLLAVAGGVSAAALARVVAPRWPFLRVLPRWISSWIRVELVPALRGPAAPLLGLRHSGVRVQRGRTYARVDGRPLRLDIYRGPTAGDGERRKPAVINVHGGAWVMGSRREQARPLLGDLAANGWVGFNVDYRLSPKVTLDEQVHDVKRAIAWVREHADELDVDPGRIVLTGGSAGGHLTALVALTAADRSRQPGFPDADTSVRAAVPFYGVYDLPGEIAVEHPGIARMVQRHVVQADPVTTPERFTRLSPLALIGADAPPFFVVHGDADSLVPVDEARRFVAALRTHSASRVTYVEVPGGEHAFDLIHSRRTADVFAQLATFLEEVVA